MVVKVNEDLRAAVVANPDDDGPRLAYAAGVRAAGDPARAEVIELQCQSPLLPAGDPVRVALERRAAELEEEHGRRWAEDDFGTEVTEVTEYRYERGFPEAIKATVGAFARHGLDWVRRNPIQDVTLIGRADPADAQTAAPAIARVKRVTLDDRGADDDIVLRLFGANQPGQVQYVNLSETWVTPPGARELLESESGTGITALDLYGCPRLRNGCPILFEHPGMARLEFLNVSRTGLGDFFTAGLLRGMRKLRRFAANDNGLTAEFIKMLVEPPTRMQLAEFSARDNPRIGDDGIEALAASRITAGLRRADLTVCGVTDRGAGAIADSPYWTEIEALCLRLNFVGRHGAVALVRTGPTLPRVLDLCGNEVPEDLAEALRREAAAAGRSVRFATRGPAGEDDDENGAWHGFPTPW